MPVRLLNQLSPMNDNQGLVSIFTSAGYPSDKLSKDDLEIRKRRPNVTGISKAKIDKISLTVFPEPVAKDMPRRLCPWSTWSSTD